MFLARPRQRAAAHAIVTSIAASQRYRETTGRVSVIYWEERSGNASVIVKRLSVDLYLQSRCMRSVVGGSG